MTPNPQPNQNHTPSHQEAPASWNVRYLLGGFDCQLTLRGETGQEVLTRAQVALKWLQENGAEPTRLPTQPAPAAEPTRSPVLADGSPDPAWCEIHGVAMARRESNGQAWYSHKLADGGYCKGKRK